MTCAAEVRAPAMSPEAAAWTALAAAWRAAAHLEQAMGHRDGRCDYPVARAAPVRSAAGMSNSTDERLERLQLEVSQLREMAMMQTAILQIMALKMGISPPEMQAMSPVPIPTPRDIIARLGPKP
jgi:hypothetical protein